MTGHAGDAASGHWVSDPWGRYPYRWFDGQHWSALVFDGTTQFLDPFVTSIRPPSSGAPVAAGAVATSGDLHTRRTATARAADPIQPLRAAARSGIAERPDTRPSAAGHHAERSRGESDDTGRRPAWVLVLGAVLVVGFVWWLYNLRGGDDGLAVTPDGDEIVSDSAPFDEAVESSIATTVATPSPTTTTDVSSSTVSPADQGIVSTGVQDCVEFIPVAAFSQDPPAQELWSAAGSDRAGLPAVCSALPPDRLAEIALQRDEYELSTTGSTSPSPTTSTIPNGQGSAGQTPAAPTPVDDSLVPVSATVPPPLPSASP